MRKLILVLLLPWLFSASAVAEEFNFRGVTWGMSRAEVMAVETALLVPTAELKTEWEQETGRSLQDPDNAWLAEVFESFLYYELTEPMWGIANGTVTYGFVMPQALAAWGFASGDKLVECGFGFVHEGEYAAALFEYQKVIAVLSERHGEPDLKEILAEADLADVFFEAAGETRWLGLQSDFDILASLYYQKDLDEAHVAVTFSLNPNGITASRLAKQ